MYSVNNKDIGLKLLPTFRRKARLVDYLYAMLKPVQYLNDLFFNYKTAVDFELKFNAQVMYLEQYLTELYDSNLLGIKIKDKANVDFVYIYNKAEQSAEQLYIYNKNENIPTYLKNKQEYDVQAHYVVEIPSTVLFDETVIRKQIDKYNAMGKNYLLKVV